MSEQLQPKRRRVNIACFSCRSRKSRCSGQRPKCSTCIELGLKCQYASTGQATETVVVGKEHFQAIEDRLNQLESRLQHGPTPASSASEHATDGLGSLAFGDEEDRAYFGPSSNIAFTSDLSRALKRLSRSRSELGFSNRQILADLQITRVSQSNSNSPVPRSAPWLGDSPTQGETSTYYLPPDHETTSLIDQYWATTGMLYPFLHEETFRDTYAQLKRGSTATRRTWLGLLNMVLAMATHTKVLSRDQERQRALPETFYRRANKLCAEYVMTGASLEIVQYLLLVSLYMQETRSSMQAWSTHGLAVKIALQLGLHSSEASKRYSPVEREIRKRTWFGCMVLDRSLSMTFGRPASIPEHYCRLELPGYFDLFEPRERQIEARRRCRHSTDFFNATIRLYSITGNVIDHLYDGNLGSEEKIPNYELIARVLRMRHLLETWVAGLPFHISLLNSKDCSLQLGKDVGIDRFRLLLTLRYHNLRILIHRVVLVRLCDSIDDYHDGQGQEYDPMALQDIARSTTQISTESAAQIIDIVRFVVDSEWLQPRRLGSWWFTLYYTFDAALVLFTVSLLTKHSSCVPIIPPSAIDSAKQTFLSCIEPLRRLDESNHTIERCCRCLQTLGEVWNAIDSHSPHENGNSQPEEDAGEDGLSFLDFDYMADAQYDVADGFLSGWEPQ
ncbi:putative C6 transcription factor [Aspergillus undulatus]|uniref:putative C6 transcription factor n=1 Tax=Aspergillus undulatus TaxID=1810928 RepID=UPI003CCCB574